MNERDPLDRLHLLSDEAERYANPLPAERVRQLGTQRRRRRHGLGVAAALAVIAIGGGAVLSQTGTGRLQPNPATTPTAVVSASPEPSTSPGATPLATPSPSRSVRSMGPDNLISASDLFKATDGKIEEWPENARPEDRVSVCQKSLTDLGATSVLSRNFAAAPTPSGRLRRAPNVYTLALQFSDAQAAMTGLQTYRDWVVSCRSTIKADPAYELISGDDKTVWIGVDTSDGTAGGFAQVPVYRDQDDRSENGYFETVGLTVLDDRLMVTVNLLYGNEKHTSYQQGGDPDSGLPEDIQFPLIKAAAKRLAR
jgi:hypothetical protein